MALKDVAEGFKNFIMRGNVVDLAVAVVIGAAFTAVVTAFSKDIVNPLLAVFGGANADGLGFQITDNPATFVNIGAVITAVIQFLITAAVVYFLVVLPMKKANDAIAARTRKGKEDEKAVPVPEQQLALLEEIRDLLAKGSAGGAPK